MKYTVLQFMKQFPDDTTCLEHLFITRFGNRDDFGCPKCGEVGKYRKLTNMPAYTCNCGHHVHPMKGTPFERSTTPLQKWFYAMYLFTTSRHGVPAKELQRQLGVTYKTAWRMGHEIRKYMAIVDGEPPLSGIVEIDETLIGGVNEGTGNHLKNKAILFGMMERGGDVITKVVPNLKRMSLFPHIDAYIEENSEIHSDELRSYETLGYGWRGYKHKTVKHRYGEYVSRDGSTHVNSLEGYWRMLQRSIAGTHIHVSPKHLEKYAKEFEFRFNMRKNPELMFSRLLAAF